MQLYFKGGTIAVGYGGKQFGDKKISLVGFTPLDKALAIGTPVEPAPKQWAVSLIFENPDSIDTVIRALQRAKNFLKNEEVRHESSPS